MPPPRPDVDPDLDVEDVRRPLHGHGPRSTSQRLAVLNLFTHPSRSSRFLTPGQAYDLLHDAGHPIDRATVYRTLSILADLGVLHVASQPPPQITYNPGAHAPHRAVCRLCGDVVELPSAVVGDLTAHMEAQLGFAAGESIVAIPGICPTCQ
jgi:Fur family ferric uptake transcriptional regulator